MNAEQLRYQRRLEQNALLAFATHGGGGGGLPNMGLPIDPLALAMVPFRQAPAPAPAPAPAQAQRPRGCCWYCWNHGIMVPGTFHSTRRCTQPGNTHAGHGRIARAPVPAWPAAPVMHHHAAVAALPVCPHGQWGCPRTDVLHWQTNQHH